MWKGPTNPRWGPKTGPALSTHVVPSMVVPPSSDTSFKPAFDTLLLSTKLVIAVVDVVTPAIERSSSASSSEPPLVKSTGTISCCLVGGDMIVTLLPGLLLFFGSNLFFVLGLALENAWNRDSGV